MHAKPVSQLKILITRLVGVAGDGELRRRGQSVHGEEA
jgi:hypothetical protein